MYSQLPECPAEVKMLHSDLFVQLYTQSHGLFCFLPLTLTWLCQSASSHTYSDSYSAEVQSTFLVQVNYSRLEEQRKGF